MNTPNNKKRRQSRERIEKAFIELMQEREINEVSVTEICKLAQINRTTFYSNYEDVYALASAVLQTLVSEVDNLYYEEVSKGFNSNDFGKLLRHIYENQLYYKTCFKLGIDKLPIGQYDFSAAERYFGGKYVEYHIEYFRAGFNQIIKMWLEGGCRETPEEMKYILESEYQPR